MICKVKNTFKEYSMPVRNQRVVVALSGGADSMALLNVLFSLRDEYDIVLEACHVNHGIRGESAERDEAFVKAECGKLGIKLHLLHADVPALSKEKGLGLEECGRQVRYSFFASLGDCLIATAHTLSDRCETLLLNETRGASLKGLCSIPAVRGNVIRPLINCTREEIEAYCAENSIQFVTDETNFDDVYSRNRIRLNVIPELKKINPSFENAVARLIASANEDESYFEAVTEETYLKAKLKNGFDAGFIKKQHPSVRKRVLVKVLKEQAGITPELVHLKLIDKILDGGTAEITGNTIVNVRNYVLTINPEAEDTTEWEYDFSSLCATLDFGKVKADIFNKNELPPKQIVHNKVLDYDSIVGNCVLRNRRAGDKMRLAGSSCTKTLKKLFNEKHLEGRNNLLILADELGILWVQGLGCADRAKITQNTKNILVVGDVQND
ncbi:MAG: tRNA lysidine(34) synthetase TilS [Clostridia bacterium]|nr:tRNA lysidine(34) synthetase TilS [Clostridia bacterium]